RLLHGLRDTVVVLRDALGSVRPTVLQPMRRALDAALETPPATLGEAVAVLQGLRDHANALALELPQNPDSDVAYWSAALVQQCHELCDDVQAFQLDPPADETINFSGIPTLAQLG